MEDNKIIIKDFFVAWNAHNIHKAISLLAENCNGGGPEGAKREFEAFFAAFPDLEVSLDPPRKWPSCHPKHHAWNPSRIVYEPCPNRS